MALKSVLLFLIFVALLPTSKAEIPMESSEDEELRKAAVEKGKLQWDLLQTKSKVIYAV